MRKSFINLNEWMDKPIPVQYISLQLKIKNDKSLGEKIIYNNFDERYASYSCGIKFNLQPSQWNEIVSFGVFFSWRSRFE